VRVFWRNGYFNTSIEMLATEMGINRFSLYATFGSKDELFIRALRGYRARVLSVRLAPLEEPGADFESIRRFFRGLLENAGTGAERWGCLIVNTAAELSAHGHAACEEVADYRSHVTDLFRRALEGAAAKKQISDDREAPQMASYLFGLLLGLSVYAKCARSPDALRDFVNRGLQALG
jgi:TetR/AcrR family transcriptional repressor of nem operon